MGRSREYFTKVPNELFPIFYTLRGVSLDLLVYIVRMTSGYHTDSFETSTRRLAKMAGISRQSVFTGLRDLQDRKLITVKSTRKSTTITLDILSKL